MCDPSAAFTAGAAGASSYELMCLGIQYALRACFTKCIDISSRLNKGSSRQKHIHIPLRLRSITCDLMWKNRSTSLACTQQNFDGCLLLAPVNTAAS